MTKATKAQQWLMMLALLLQPTFDKSDYSEIYCISLFTGSRLCEVSRHAEDLLTCFLPNWSYFWNKIHEQLMMTVCCHYFSTLQYSMVKCKNTSIYRCQTTFLVYCVIIFQEIKYEQKVSLIKWMQLLLLITINVTVEGLSQYFHLRHWSFHIHWNLHPLKTDLVINWIRFSFFTHGVFYQHVDRGEFSCENIYYFSLFVL